MLWSLLTGQLVKHTERCGRRQAVVTGANVELSMALGSPRETKEAADMLQGAHVTYGSSREAETDSVCTDYDVKD